MPEATTQPDAAAMRGVIPYLSLGGRAGEAADFYIKAFGARDLGRYPDEDKPSRFMHIELEINGGCLMMTDCQGPGESAASTPQGFGLNLVVADGDHWWSRALAAGCTQIMTFEKQSWGDRWGLLRDPFGFEWGINEPGEPA